MGKSADLSSDDLLAQATCAILIDDEVKGTAWLVDDKGRLLTAGHILGENNPRDEVEVHFVGDIPRKAHRVDWGYQKETGVDFAALQLTSVPADRRPLPFLLAREVRGTLKARGYGQGLQDQSAGIGKFLGPYDLLNSPSNRIFLFDSKQLGEVGYSGAAIFSDELQAVVAVQIETTKDDIGPGRDTILAMPLYRIAQVCEWLVYPTSLEPDIVHRYSLLKTQSLIGRRDELSLLTDWVAKPDTDIYQAHVLVIVAMGGIGKSALIWEWFNNIASQVMQPLAGQLWWSFYENDSFEDFIVRTLAYVSQRPKDEIQELSQLDRQNKLYNILVREPFLLVLDGLERITISHYADTNAGHVVEDIDEEAIDPGEGLDLPESARQPYKDRHRLREFADRRFYNFFSMLSDVRTARIVVSTRLYPIELENVDGEPLPRIYRYNLRGLSDDDALELWQTFKVSGLRETLIHLFNKSENYPLLIQVLAGEVARYRPAPRDFDQWWQDHHEKFDLSHLPLVQKRTHILEFAWRGLDEVRREVLYTIAVATRRKPVEYRALVLLLVRPRPKSLVSLILTRVGKSNKFKGFEDSVALENVLTELEDRALIGWDRLTNQYNMHSVVRELVLSSLKKDDNAQSIYGILHSHLEALLKIQDWRQVNSLEDLTVPLELYDLKLDLGRYNEAFAIFRDHLAKAMLYRLSDNRRYLALVKKLFPEGVKQLPRLRRATDQAYTLNAIAQGYKLSGQPAQAAELYERHNRIRKKEQDLRSLSIGLCNLADTECLLGALRLAEAAARQAMLVIHTDTESVFQFQEAICLRWLGLILAARGVASEAKAAFKQSLLIFRGLNEASSAGVTTSYFAQGTLWLGDFTTARELADHAWELAHIQRKEGDFIRAALQQGAAALELGDYVIADERLHHALARSRTVGLVEEEIPALIGLAELQQRQGNLEAARELLEDMWELAERGPYLVFQADAYNVLAQIERDTDNYKAAVEVATMAYRLAWCDGPPFAYQHGLEKAQAHLQALDRSIPDDLPPYEESAYEPMPRIAIDPLDEFVKRKA